MTPRPVARAVACLAVLVLGVVAARRLPLHGVSVTTFPGLSVHVSLPTARDPADVARDLVVPVESAVRSLGDVTSLAGWVRPDGLTFGVRFTAGTGTEAKAARLIAELGTLRDGLPDGATFEVWPAEQGGGDELVLALTDTVEGSRAAESSAERIADALRAIPGVRSVTSYGATSERVSLELAPDVAERGGVAAVVDAVRRGLHPAALGETTAGGRTTSVRTPSRPALESSPVVLDGQVTTLASLGRLTHDRAEPRRLIRFGGPGGGRRGLALVVAPEPSVSPLALDGSVREAARRLSDGRTVLTVWADPADPLRRLLSRLALAALAGSLALGLLGHLLLRAPLASLVAVPLVLAAALNALWLLGLSLHPASLLSLALGVGAVVPAVLLGARHRGRFLGALALLTAAVPIAVTLGSATLAPLLGESALALFATVAAGAASVALLPAAPPRPPSPRARRALRRALRDPFSAALLAGSSVAVLLTLFGQALDPRLSAAGPQDARLSFAVSLPSGTSLLATEERVARIESRFAGRSSVLRTWSVVSPAEATLRVDLRPGLTGDETRRITTALVYLAGPDAILDPRRTRPGLDLGESLEDEAETDEDAYRYRLLLRCPDLPTLQAAHERVLQRLAASGVPSDAIRSDWGAPTRQVELHPLPGGDAFTREAVLTALRRRTEPSAPLTLEERPERLFVATAPGLPARAEDLPQRAALLSTALRLPSGGAVPERLFGAEETLVPPAVRRQSGRFVLPITVRSGKTSRDVRLREREAVDRALGLLTLPEGGELVRPEVASLAIPKTTWRLALLAGLLPTLLLLGSAVLLDSAGAAAGASVPFVIGLAFAAPVLGAYPPSEPHTLLALFAALATSLPLGLLLLDAGTRRDAPALYRSLRHLVAGAAAALAVCGVSLGVTLGTDPAEDAWVGPLRVSLVTTAATTTGALLALPAFVLLLRAARRRAAEGERGARRVPLAWQGPSSPPTLAVRSLTKRYGATGFRALHDVSFELSPGIVGLLGPNGAGKTTLLRVLTGLLSPTRGQVLYRGVPLSPRNLASYRGHLGFLPQEFNAYPGFTAFQLLDYWALERGHTSRREREDEIERLLAAVGLVEDRDRKVRDFSGGMRQRVGIARALLGSPPILVIDEPTTGLDLEARARLQKVLRGIAAERIVILSTHLASDVEATASRVLLVLAGRLLFDGTPEELMRRGEGRVFETLVSDRDLRELGRRYRLVARVRTPEGIRVRGVASPGSELPGPAASPTLEEAYLAEIQRLTAAGDGASRAFSLGERPSRGIG